MKPVNHITVQKGMKVSDLVNQMANSGVMGAGRVAKASNILFEMLSDKDCTVFLGLAGAMVPGGMKNVLVDMLASGKIKVFVTTGANLTHDIFEALGFNHFQGSAKADDAELHKKGIDRIYDTFLKNDVYEKMEDFFKENYYTLSQTKNIKEFLWKLGEILPGKDSILKICFEKKIPIFCPGIADSGIGLMIWGRQAEGKKFDLPVFEDMKEIISTAWDSKKNGVIYIGGGLPKNFIQQSMQFSKGASYGVQISTDMPQWGGSSGANLCEGISWGKMKEEGKYIDVYCDATIALPLIWASVKSNLS
ncbi:deoxyhypusine synthase [Candidatus Woesearchaeota archaeon]|nr:deoxyhypusine synthase [Candidatus Woesearchaeota archaeon]MBW3006137.1 deoxyhypusine synthase [Candidatus Woesearchaeota archaeon]